MASDELIPDDERCNETDPRFPSGQWQGFYVQSGTKHPMSAQLRFRRGRISGDGMDGVGGFRMAGTYNLDGGQVTLRKHYFAQHMVVYIGNGGPLRSLQGRWDLRADGLCGFWRLWPVDADDDEWVVESVTVERCDCAADPIDTPCPAANHES